jgi:hypothetical protein
MGKGHGKKEGTWDEEIHNFMGEFSLDFQLDFSITRCIIIHHLGRLQEYSSYIIGISYGSN